MKIIEYYYDSEMNQIPKNMAESLRKKFNEKWELQTEIPGNRLYVCNHMDWYKPHEEFIIWKRIEYQED